MQNDYSLNSLWQRTSNTVAGWFSSTNQTNQQSQLRALSEIRHLALSMYDGQCLPQLKIRPNQPDDNIYVNYPEVIVDKGVAFLFGDSLKISIGTSEDTRGETHLDRIWSPEQRDEDLIDAATDGGIFGDAYLKIRINEVGDPEVVTLDPNNMSVQCDPENYRQVQKYVCQYEHPAASGEQVLYKEETSSENGIWIIREFEGRPNGNWSQIGKDISWNYSFAPIFHCKNLPRSKSYYGKPDLTRNVLALSKYLSRLDSLIGKIIRIHGSPKPFAVGLDKSDLQIGTDEMVFLPEVDQKIGLLEMSGDLLGAMAFRKQMREALAEISKVPEVASGKTEHLGQLSGLALQILYGPLIEQNNKKQRLYGAMITRIVGALLEIGGFKSLTTEIVLHWSNSMPVSDKDEADAAVALKGVGFSEDTLIKRLGGDPEHEREMRKLDSNSLGDALSSAFNSGTQTGNTYQ